MIKQSPLTSYNAKVGLLVLLTVVTFFVHTGALPTDIMEMRNMVTAREMVEDDAWMVPTMNGELRLEKPPLPTWIAAAIWAVCPDSLAVERLAPGLMGSVMTLFLFLICRYLSRRENFPFYACVVFLTCYNVVLMGRSATWDIYCHAFMMGAVYFLWRGLRERGAQWGRFAAAGVMMGLSFLSKGPVSFYALLLPALVAMLVDGGLSLRDKVRPFLLMIVLMIVVGGWWYACLLVLHPDAVAAVAEKESGSWVNHNVRPWYYYWRFFLEMGVWALLMLAALFVGWWRRHNVVKREYVFSITWALAALVLLSLMPEKKMRYLLPLMPACAMAVACVLIDLEEARKKSKLILWAFRITCVVVGLVCVALLPALLLMPQTQGLVSGWAVWAGLIMLWLPAIIVFIALRHSRPSGLVVGVAMVFVVAECFLLSPIGHAFGNPDAYSIRHIRSDNRLNGIPLYYDSNNPDGLRIELVYEAGRKIRPLNLQDSAAVLHAAPCAILTRQRGETALPASALDSLKTMHIGWFDDNKHPRSNSHYNKAFLNCLTLLQRKSIAP